MKNIANKDLEPGMILAETVKTRGGQLIAKSGTVLTKQLILHMGFYNIESVAIVFGVVGSSLFSSSTIATDSML